MSERRSQDGGGTFLSRRSSLFWQLKPSHTLWHYRGKGKGEEGGTPCVGPSSTSYQALKFFFPSKLSPFFLFYYLLRVLSLFSPCRFPKLQWIDWNFQNGWPSGSKSLLLKLYSLFQFHRLFHLTSDPRWRHEVTGRPRYKRRTE